MKDNATRHVRERATWGWLDGGGRKAATTAIA